MEADDMSLRVASFSCYLNNTEESFVQRIGGSSEDLPPDAPFPVRARASANHVVKTSSNVKIAKTALDHSKDHKVSAADHGVESFSSYPRTPESSSNNNNSFAFKTASGTVEDPAVAFIFPQHVNPSGSTAKHLERKIIGQSRKDGEISIFDADKYFNMKLDPKFDFATAPRSGKIKNKNEIPVESPCTKPKSSTVSVCSEPSSLGSQAVLLHNPQRNSIQTKPRKAIRRSFFGRLVCQGGHCLDKKAVVIDEIPDHGSKRADNFQKNSGNTLRREEEVTTATKQMEEEEEQRKSLEVFGAHKMRKGDVAVNLERKLSVLTWDAIPKAQNNHVSTPTTIGSNSNTICDDMASDASSDLFEIENISTSTGYGLMLTSQTADYTSGCASPITQYAPSEASISWSVVTSSAADHSSVISDYDEKSVSIFGGTIHRTTASRTNKFKDVAGKSSPKTSSAGLLRRNGHGAVNISEAARNTSDRRKVGKSIHNCHSPEVSHLHA